MCIRDRHTRDITGAVIGKHQVTISMDAEEEKSEMLPQKYRDRKQTDQAATVDSGNNTINFDLKSK